MKVRCLPDPTSFSPLQYGTVVMAFKPMRLPFCMLLVLLVGKALSFRSSAATFSAHPRALLVGRTHAAHQSPEKKQTTLFASVKQQREHQTVAVGDCVGSGSYGTVHLLTTTLGDSKSKNNQACIGKRAWTIAELSEQNPDRDDAYLQDKAARCAYYWKVERHCFEQLPPHPNLPLFRGVSNRGSVKKNGGANEPWLLFDCAATNGSNPIAAPSVADILSRDRFDHQRHDKHHLFLLQQALGVDTTNVGNNTDNSNHATIDNPLAKTIEVFLEQLLTVLKHVHSSQIVHRDVKPANILISHETLFLIDFGSAADVATAGFLKKNIGWGERVAISPIYAAPEVFCEPNKAPTHFDVFSAAMIACQLIFQYRDERTDAGFHQQLAVHDNNLEAWLKTQWQGKVRASGLMDGLQVLADRPGLWALLQDMLVTEPQHRLSSAAALKRLQNLRQTDNDSLRLDGKYLDSIIKALEECPIPTARPLEFVASFSRQDSLGLLLTEADAADTSDMDATGQAQWKLAVTGAAPGQVFVQGIVAGGQAEEMGIFEIGDQLQGVGELPVGEGGFEKVVEMLGDQTKRGKYTTLHFDRKSALVVGMNEAEALPIPSMKGFIQVIDQGAWSSTGRRKAQEDTFVVTEIHDTRDRSMLFAGVMDGHLGMAASKLVQEVLPSKFSRELLQRAAGDGDSSAASLLQRAWDETCDDYRLACGTDGDNCIAEYDALNGILLANTASDEYAAGTTTCVVALEKKTSHLAILNCGDSRCLVIDNEGKLVFKTTDHKPEREIERFTLGREQGLDYGIPECRMARWYVPVGEYEYAVSRSLEGSFATSKGIVSTADITTLQVTAGTIVTIASDGLWEVMDSKEVAKISFKLRWRQGLSAGDAAKTLCSMALEKGSSDNVSVVILYLD